MSRWLNRVRQWCYPAAFRIAAGGSDANVVAFVAAELSKLEQALAHSTVSAAAAASDHRPDPGPCLEAEEASSELTKDFVLDLCNIYYRLARASQASSGSGARKTGRHLDRMRNLLAEKGIECLDLAGQVYEEGRLDFEPLGEPQPDPSLSRMTILNCERPLVKLHGRLVQKAKGFVGKPEGT